jgi:serine/threonine protein phosphatase PrpC
LFVSADTSEHQVLPGDVLLLCSDGLHGAVPATELASILDHNVGHNAGLPAAAERLVELANQRDGSDNITVQLIRIRSVERIGMYRGRPYKLR